MSCVFDLYEPEETEVRALVRERMTHAIPLDVPLVVEIGGGELAGGPLSGGCGEPARQPQAGGEAGASAGSAASSGIGGAPGGSQGTS
jgi:hypothetical protein